MILLLAFTRIVMFGSVIGVEGGFCGEGVEISGESDVRGGVMVVMLLLVKGFTEAIFEFNKTSVLSVKGLTTTEEFFLVQ